MLVTSRGRMYVVVLYVEIQIHRLCINCQSQQQLHFIFILSFDVFLMIMLIDAAFMYTHTHKLPHPLISKRELVCFLAGAFTHRSICHYYVCVCLCACECFHIMYLHACVCVCFKPSLWGVISPCSVCAVQ